MFSQTTNGTVQALARLTALDPATARRELQDLVLRMVNEFLGREPGDLVGPRDRLIDAGFDSLRALDFSAQLGNSLLCELRPTVVFDHPTPEALAAHLAERVLDIPASKARAAEDADEGLAEELERASNLPEEEMRILLARSRHRLRRLERERGQPIAIVGMACRFPGGVYSPEDLWRLFDEGRSAIADVEESRWPISQLYHPDRNVPGRINTRRAGMLDNVTDFDARFFNISPKEANELDPQQRLLLEVSWEALERANMPASELYGGDVGVFVGIKSSEYFDSQKSGLPEESGSYRATGNSLSTAAGRISYTFGFTGPCFPVDTACSSSLVALHLAVQSLRRGECAVALAGGANVLIDPHISVGLAKANMLSSDGKCKTFDAAADGYVRAEGCGILVLKPLSRALADGNRIHAVVRGTAINQDGASGGLTVPSGPGQEAVIRAALADAQVQPWEVGFVEAHGTGTALGDPIEIAALDNVFGGAERFHGQPLIVGAGKTNHGHMECAAGVAGVIKTVLALQNERIPKSLYFDNPNPRIPWDRTVVKVAKEPVDWRRGAVPRIAGVSSYGFSGTNAHVILEEAPPRRRPKRPAPRQGGELVPLSARAESDLAGVAARYAEHLESGDLDLTDVALTAATGRSHHPFRAAVVAEDLPGLVDRLRALAEGSAAAGIVQGVAPAVEPGVAFLFTGQGAQRAGMGRHLYETEPVFRQTVDRSAAVLDESLGVPLTEVLWGRHADRIDDTRYTQPAMVAFQLALASLWESWGIRPRWVLGHSIGEVSAAWSAGVLTLEQALVLAETRGRFMDGLEERGSMAAVQAAPDRVEALLAGRRGAVCIAAYNGPQAVVIAGRTEGVLEVSAALQAEGLRVVPLRVSHAFHSPLMDPMLEGFRQVAAGLSVKSPHRDWISTVTPGLAPAEDNDYWARNVRDPVRFSEGIQALAAQGCRVFLEVGPAGTLLAMGRACVSVDGASWIPSQHSEGHGRGRALAALGQLYVAGVGPSWPAVHANARAQKVELPTYPFHRRRYWMQRVEGPLVRGAEVHPLLGVQLPLPPLSGGETVYSNHLSERSPAWLAGHRVGDGAVFPAAGYLEVGFALAATGQAPASLADLKISIALPLDERGRQVATVVTGTDAGPRVDVRSRVQDGAWTTHATWALGAPEAPSALIDREALLARCGEDLELDDLYEGYGERGLHYGEAFRGLKRVAVGDREVVALVSLPPGLVDQRYLVHPAALDACFQAAGALAHDRDETLLPVGVERAVLHRRVEGADVWCRATMAAEGEDFVVLDVTLFDGEGRPCVEIRGLRLVATRAFRRTGEGTGDGLVYSTRWERVGEPPAQASGQDGEAKRSWLVLADQAKVGDELVWLLDEQGAQVSALRRDQVDPQDPGALDEILSELGGRCSDLVYLWSLDPGAGEPGRSDTHEQALGALLAVVQAAGRAAGPPPRLTIVTRGAQEVGTLDQELDLKHAPLWGFAAALAKEVPAMQCRCIDLGPGGDPRDAAAVFRELWHDDGERRVAYRGGQRYAARLVAGLEGSSGLAVPPGPGFELRTSGYGTLQNLALRPLTPAHPGPGEVQVEVSAAALNFKDVLHAMGVLAEFSARRGIHRAEDQPLGLECAGRIVALGAGVEGLHVGDEVVALTDGSLASHVTLQASRVGPKPETWQATEAAGLQTVFFTAAYGLVVLANLRPGDRVLIQAAAGGVGQAAVQICQWIGAEIYATASEGKWNHLRGQGVERVMDSRKLDYSDTILRMTNGRGVDVVLNSLNEEHIPKSLAALAQGGRFVEIGKVGIWDAARMAAARPDVAYHTFDLGEVLAERPSLYAELFARLAPGFSSGRLRPVPTKVFPLAEGLSAFQLLASGKTIGKVVLAMPAPDERGPRAVRADRSYVVSGGVGALGLKTAAWLARQGAGALVLLGRREPGPEAMAALDALRRDGTRVHVMRVDVTDREELHSILDELIPTIPPVGGIVHAAGVLADGLVDGLDWDRCWSVMAPKVAGGWNLHEWSTNHALDWFVGYASIASVIGSAGQTSYAAANAFLEGLAYERRRLGLAGTSIHWGAWAGGGMAHAQFSAMRKRMRRLGLRELAPEDALDALGSVLAVGAAKAVVASVHWATYAKSAPAEPFLGALSGAPGRGGVAEGGGFRATVLAAAPEERLQLLLGFLRRHVAAVVGVSDADEISTDTKFAELGVDSLLALDLRTVLEQGLQTTLSTTMVFDHPTVGSLMTYLAGLLPKSHPNEPASA